MRNLVGLFLAVLVGLAATPASSWETLYLVFDNLEPDTEFIVTLAAEDAGLQARENPKSHIQVGRFDLNRDGRDELIVGFRTIADCGRGDCRAKIYERVGGTWRFAGEISANAVGSEGDTRLRIYGEDEYHNGWRVLSRGAGVKYCWVIMLDSATSDTEASDLSGYFGRARINGKCPP